MPLGGGVGVGEPEPGGVCPPGFGGCVPGSVGLVGPVGLVGRAGLSGSGCLAGGVVLAGVWTTGLGVVTPAPPSLRSSGSEPVPSGISWLPLR
ncbi:hypothetical protein SFUMM280S_10875 [Streptomyces fumanus]